MTDIKCFKELEEGLVELGLVEDARCLYQTRTCSYNTSYEMIGELGVMLQRIQRSIPQSAVISLRKMFANCASAVQATGWSSYPLMTKPDEREMAYIANSLRRLRKHFKAWDLDQGREGRYEGREYDLIGHAFYEGSTKSAASGRIIVETVPFALGQELVNYYGFEWLVFERIYEVATYAVEHPRIDDPIDLLGLEDGGWYEPDEQDDEPPRPGEITYDSLDPILKAANMQRRPWIGP